MNIDYNKQIPIKLPKFYQDVLDSWHLSGGGKKHQKMLMISKPNVSGEIALFNLKGRHYF